ncbi:hypothetical protein [Melghirimyces algeriensis]|uniref:hypothetical protein n=1 Tax=Melghirimyces algeriensis TaxID=910412 RepID=UPI00163D3EA4|nr:hypothetical protein [Melghirimyces algeriensis]
MRPKEVPVVRPKEVPVVRPKEVPVVRPKEVHHRHSLRSSVVRSLSSTPLKWEGFPFAFPKTDVLLCKYAN